MSICDKLSCKDENFSNEYVLMNIKNNYKTIIVKRDADLTKYEYFYFKDSNSNIEKFKEIIRQFSFKIRINDILIEELPFKLLIELNPVAQKGDTFIIKIPEFLFKHINTISLNKSKLYFDFDFSYNFEDIKLCKQLTYVEADVRTSITTNIVESLIQQIIYSGSGSVGIKNNHISISIPIPIKKGFIIKGIFILGNLNNIDNLTLNYNNFERFNYNYQMLYNVAHIISPKLFYISFKGSNNYKDLSIESFYGSAFVKEEKDTMSLKLDLYEEEIYEVYILNGNVLQYNCDDYGMVKLKL